MFKSPIISLSWLDLAQLTPDRGGESIKLYNKLINLNTQLHIDTKIYLPVLSLRTLFTGIERPC